MAEDKNTEQEGTSGDGAAAAPAAEKATRKPRKPRTAKPGEEFNKSSYRVTCTPRVIGTLYDSDLGITIPRTGSDVVVPGPIKEGSWLHCQIKGGLVLIVD